MPRSGQLDDLLTAQQVAEQYDWNKRSINRFAAAGKLEVHHQAPGANGQRLFKRSDVEKLVAAQRAAQ